MEWEKLGLIFHVDQCSEWMYSHASNPVAVPMHDSWVRIYFSTRDNKSVSRIASLELNLEDLSQIENISSFPVVDSGKKGLFDDSGASLGNICCVKDKVFLYYLGWNLSCTVPWRNSIGLACMEDDATFKKYSQAPILDRNDVDPYSLSYPFVMLDQGLFKMWYGSNQGWGDSSDREFEYVIKYAESQDGILWTRTGAVLFDVTDTDYAFARPSVIKDGDCYRMWYCYRGETYRIGYAESGDGQKWLRKDNLVGIQRSLLGWDSEMICYPYVFQHKTDTYMLYNGNGYGKSGFGLAKLLKS